MLAELKKLLDGEKGKFEHNGVTVSNDGSVVLVVAIGLFTPPMSFELNKAQLRLLHSFVSAFNTNDYDTYLVKLNNGIRLIAENEFEQDELDLYEDGTAIVFSGRRSGDCWDRWLISSDGSVEYTGTVEGYRRMPAWMTESSVSRGVNMSTERDTAVVVLDLLAGMTYYHDGSELGEVYAELYQLVAQRLLSDEQQSRYTTADVHQQAVEFLNAFYRLPEADRQILRVLLKEVMTVPAND